MVKRDTGILSPYLGEIEWESGCELYFPAGLPGFEQYRRMVPVEIPSQRPLVYLQSAEKAEVCFLSLPVLVVHPGFEVYLSDEDRSLLGLDPPAPASGGPSATSCPALGIDVLCLALLVPYGPTVKTNLDAPIVINLHNGRGMQAIAPSAAAGSWQLSRQGGWEAVC